MTLNDVLQAILKAVADGAPLNKTIMCEVVDDNGHQVSVCASPEAFIKLRRQTSESAPSSVAFQLYIAGDELFNESGVDSDKVETVRDDIYNALTEAHGEMRNIESEMRNLRTSIENIDSAKCQLDDLV